MLLIPSELESHRSGLATNQAGCDNAEHAFVDQYHCGSPAGVVAVDA